MCAPVCVQVLRTYGAFTTGVGICSSHPTAVTVRLSSTTWYDVGVETNTGTFAHLSCKPYLSFAIIEPTEDFLRRVSRTETAVTQPGPAYRYGVAKHLRMMVSSARGAICFRTRQVSEGKKMKVPLIEASTLAVPSALLSRILPTQSSITPLTSPFCLRV